MLRAHLAIFAALSLALAACGAGAPSPSAPHAMLGRAVEMSLPTNRGQLETLPARGAAFTVADYFGPSCVPCREAVPRLHARKADFEAAGGRLVLIAVLGDGESTEDARRALESWGVTGERFLVDNGDASKREAGVRSLPTTLVLDARAVVRWAAPPGATAEDVLRAARAAR